MVIFLTGNDLETSDFLFITSFCMMYKERLAGAKIQKRLKNMQKAHSYFEYFYFLK